MRNAETILGIIRDLHETRHWRAVCSDELHARFGGGLRQKARMETSAAAYPTKYRPDYPNRFGSLPEAQNWARLFFTWYNHDHRHSGLALMTPATVHHGLAAEITARRQQVLQAAYAQHPERFVKGAPIPHPLPTAVWINPPSVHVEQGGHRDSANPSDNGTSDRSAGAVKGRPLWADLRSP